MWFILVIISALTVSISNIFRRVLMREKDSDPLSSTILFMFIVAAITFIFAFMFGFNIPPFFQYPLNFILSTVLWAMSTIAYFYAAKYIEASKITIIASLGAVVSIIAGIIFLGERFTVNHLVGAIMVLYSVYLINKETIKVKNNKGLIFALFAMTFSATAVVSDTYILRHYDAISYTPVISILPAFLLLVIRPKAVLRFKKLIDIKYLRNMLFLGLFYGVQAIAYYLALNLGANISQVSPIAKIEIIFTVLLSALFLKETKNLKIKIISAIIATFGVLFLR